MINLKILKKSLSKHKLLAFDTNVFAYYLNRLSSFYVLSENLFQFIAEYDVAMVTSILTLAELLSLQAPKSMLNMLESEFFLIPKLKVLEVDRRITTAAAAIRRDYGYKLPDAIQLATALSAKAKVFIINDRRLKSFKKLKVISLSDLA